MAYERLLKTLSFHPKLAYNSTIVMSICLKLKCSQTWPFVTNPHKSFTFSPENLLILLRILIIHQVKYQLLYDLPAHPFLRK
jgi:hypothetical protein